MSRRHVTDAMVVQAAWDYKRQPIGGPFVNEMLVAMTGEPLKVCDRAIERAMGHGYVDCGVSERTCWPTPEGLDLLAAV